MPGNYRANAYWLAEACSIANANFFSGKEPSLNLNENFRLLTDEFRDEMIGIYNALSW